MFESGISLAMNVTSNVTIRNDLRHGDLGSLIYLHSKLYQPIQGFDLTFEIYVAEILLPFFKHHTERERMWIVEQQGEVKGSIAILRFSEAEAQLRWFLLHPDLRGLGIGKQLVNEAVAFAKNQDYTCCHLWTVRDLKTAGYLYQSIGFQCVQAVEKVMWGAKVTEEKYFVEF